MAFFILFTSPASFEKSIRSPPDNPRLRGAMALNISLVSSDASVKARFFSSANFSPTA